MGYHNYPYPSYVWAYQGVDFAGISGMSASKAQDMYNDGIRFVGRYLYSTMYPNGKGISQQEAGYYLNAGIRIFLYYEVNTSDALGGTATGEVNGQTAYGLANALQVPTGTPIICCCDTSVSDAVAATTVMDYLEAFASKLPGYNVGIYGGSNVMAACYAKSPAYYRVQAGAWGSTEFDPINIRQWYIPKNSQALSDGYIHIQNISIDANGYATWRGNSVDLLSADTIANMWGDSSPTPPIPYPTSKMPIWFYLKKKDLM